VWLNGGSAENLTGGPDANINLQGSSEFYVQRRRYHLQYTTKMAVEDGVLIPIPGDIHQPLGIKFPVFFNDSVWNNYVDPFYQCF
jgi:hypothetical protein